MAYNRLIAMSVAADKPGKAATSLLWSRLRREKGTARTCNVLCSRDDGETEKGI